MLDRYCLPDTLASTAAATNAQYSLVMSMMQSNNASMLFLGLYYSTPIIGIVCLTALVLSYVYILFMRTCARGMSWISVGIFVSSGVLLGAWLIREGYSLRTENKSTEYVLYFFGGVVYVLIGLYSVYILVHCKSLRLSFNMANAGSEFLSYSQEMMMVPIVFFMALFAWWMAFCVTMVYLSSIGDIAYNPNGVHKV